QNGQTVHDDRQVAEQIYQQVHASVVRYAEWQVAASYVSVDCQHLPAEGVTALGQRGDRVEFIRCAGAIDREDGLGTVRAHKRESRTAAVDAAVVVQVEGNAARRHIATHRRMTCYQDSVRD